MKIVLTVHQFLPDYAAGTEILTFDTARELQGRGHEVIVWTAYPDDESGLVDVYEHEGIKVYRYHFNQQQAARSSDLIAIDYCNNEFKKIFSDFLKKFKPDIVHFFHLFRLSATAIYAARELRIPTIFTATDFWMVCPTCQMRLYDNSMCLGPDRFSTNCIKHVVAANLPHIYNKIKYLPNWVLALACWGMKQRWWKEKQYSSMAVSLVRRKGYLRDAMNQLDRVLVPTKLMNEMLVRHGLAPERAVYVPFGINLKHVDNAPPKKHEDVLRLGFIGTLYEHKGVHILLEALKLIPKEVPIQLKIYGKEQEFPDYVDKLKKMAGSDRRISFCGTFPNKDIGIVFSELDVLVVPSIWYENTPLVIYSAQSTGTPVIATNLGGMSEVIEHELNGLLFEKGNALELSRHILRLARDRDLLKNLSSKAKKPKSITTYVDEIEGLYLKVLSGGRKR